MNENRLGCLKTLLIVIVTVVVFGGIFGSCGNNSRRANSYSSSARATARSTATEKPTQPSTEQFGDDAETIAGEIKASLGENYKFSWFASGYKFSFTAKTTEISGDDLAVLYGSAPAYAQSLIDELNESMQDANKSTLDRFRALGYRDCTVIFTLSASDGMEICTVENGKITHKITQENFKFG